jgi:hypothetical protein
MNLTLSADSKTIEDARAWANAHGTSLNALIRDYLATFGKNQELEEAARLFCENARTHAGCSAQGVRFSREELYSGKRFGNARS